MELKSLPDIKSDDLWDSKPDTYTQQVEAGMKGLNAGLHNGLGRINNYLYGIHAKRYYLIGADSGVGKTTLADFMFVFSAWISAKKQGIPIYIKYLSYELSRDEKFARWTSLLVKILYDRDMPADYIMGRIPGLKVSEEDFKMIRTARRYINDMCNDMEMQQTPMHPTWILNWMIEHFDRIGKIERLPSTEKLKSGKPKPGHIVGYKAHDPRAITILVCDHMALIHGEKDANTTKAAMDKTSNYVVMLRNLFGLTACMIQQFNTELTSTHRNNRKGELMFSPQRLDFGDSKYTYRDADVVFGMLSPVQFELETFMDYDITQLNNYFIALFLMKNRYGSASKMLPLFMNPIAGVFEDLPLDGSNELAMEPYYNKAQALDKVGSLYIPKLLI